MLKVKSGRLKADTFTTTRIWLALFLLSISAVLLMALNAVEANPKKLKEARLVLPS